MTLLHNSGKRQEERETPRRAGRFSQKKVERCIVREGKTVYQLIRKTYNDDFAYFFVLSFTEFGWAMYCLYLHDYIIPPKQGGT
jgi:hypothetical protein